MQGQCEPGAKVPGRNPKDAAGKVGSVLGQELVRVAFMGIFEASAPRCDARHRGDLFFGFNGAAPKAQLPASLRFSHKGTKKARSQFASGTAPNAHAKWGPASLPTPTIRCRSSHLRYRASRSADLATDSPKRAHRGARRNDPATVWSAPFRGPAAPGKPFVILSEHLPKQPFLSSDGLLSISPVGFTSTRGNRGVP